MVLNLFDCQDNCVSVSIALFVASIPSQAAVVAPLVKLYGLYMYSKIDMECISPDSLLLHDSLYSWCPDVALMDEIVCFPCLVPSIMRAAVPIFP